MNVDLLTAAISAIPLTPDELLDDWLPGGDAPRTMTLATLGTDGAPDARTVMLSEWGPDGFWFHTDDRSRKAEQLAADGRVALVLTWGEAKRQLVVRGTAEPASAEEESRAFRAQSEYLQQLAWLSTDDFARRPFAERVAAWRAFADAHPEGLEPPETWAGYLVRPTRLAFWVGSDETASRRVEYARAAPGAAWTMRVLAG